MSFLRVMERVQAEAVSSSPESLPHLAALLRPKAGSRVLQLSAIQPVVTGGLSRCQRFPSIISVNSMCR